MTAIKPELKVILRISALLFLILIFTASAGSALSFTSAVLETGAKYMDDAIEIASRVSGKTLTSADRKIMLRQLQSAVVKHGDEAILAARKGGLELMEAAGEYGDDVWAFASKVPSGARALAIHPDELLPFTRRIGTEVLELEARSPGLTRYVVKDFGDNSVKYFAKNIMNHDATRLIGYAERADTPAIRQMLMDYYKKGGTDFLDKLNWKHIMASGLSAAMIISAYQVSDGVQEGLTTVAKNSPDTFRQATDHFIDRATMPVIIPATVLGLGFIIIWLIRYYLKNHKNFDE